MVQVNLDLHGTFFTRFRNSTVEQLLPFFDLHGVETHFTRFSQKIGFIFANIWVFFLKRMQARTLIAKTENQLILCMNFMTRFTQFRFARYFSSP
jgi:hypothetical protein